MVALTGARRLTDSATHCLGSETFRIARCNMVKYIYISRAYQQHKQVPFFSVEILFCCIKQHSFLAVTCAQLTPRPFLVIPTNLVILIIN